MSSIAYCYTPVPADMNLSDWEDLAAAAGFHNLEPEWVSSDLIPLLPEAPDGTRWLTVWFDRHITPHTDFARFPRRAILWTRHQSPFLTWARDTYGIVAYTSDEEWITPFTVEDQERIDAAVPPPEPSNETQQTPVVGTDGGGPGDTERTT